jgi:hypothetical protein
MLLASKITAPFMERPKIKQWISSIQSPTTAEGYSYHLMRFLEAIAQDPDAFLQNIEKNPKEMSITTKAYLGSVQSKTVARFQLCAIKSFLRFYEMELPLNGLRIRVARVRKKPYLTWTDAEKIIGECKEPYRSAFRFMLWSGIGLDEFTEIQQSAEIQANIEAQRNNVKQYIRIDLRPRKSNVDVYYVLTPKQYVPKFPLRTADYGNRGGALIDRLDAELNWRRATVRANMRQVGLGPHTLRSAFRSQCAKVGVADAVAEFCLGHGSHDKYGYSRETTDEEYLAGELGKLWKRPVIDRPDISELRKQIKADVEKDLKVAIDSASKAFVGLGSDVDRLRAELEKARNENTELRRQLKSLDHART